MPTTDNPILGFEGTLTVNSVSPGFRNMRFGTTFTEVDATTNRDGGEKVYVKGLKESYITFDLVIDDGSDCATVMTAVNARTPVPVTAELGDITLTANMLLFGGEVTVDADNVATMSITARKAAGTTST